MSSAASTTVSVPHAQCAVEEVVSTFGAICGEEPTHEPDPGGRPKQQSISGIISLVGDVSWSVMLSFDCDTATSMAQTFAGFEIPFDSADMADVIGELANVVAGGLARRLECVGVKAELGLPTVARGGDVETVVPAATVVYVERFTSKEGRFWLEVAAA